MIRSQQTSVGRELERLLRDGIRPALSDARLLDRYLVDHDESAFETLVERHGPMVLSLCRRYLRDPRDVEDAFQATFLILVRKGSSLRDAASLSSWLYGVAYRVAARARADVMKRRAREGEPDGLPQALAPLAQPPDDSLETLDAELSRLPEKYRAPLVLCYLEGRTHEQAAAELGWPVGTVRSRMAKARSILETRLTRRGLDASACLAVLRPEFFLTSTVLPSLTSISTTWPATALAQGVLAAMLISQLKWIGVGTTAVGLVAATAGMGALAVNTPASLEDVPSRPTQAAKPTPVPTPSPRPTPRPQPRPNDDVQARLAEMEQKIDRLMELLHRMEERSLTTAGRLQDPFEAEQDSPEPPRALHPPARALPPPEPPSPPSETPSRPDAPPGIPEDASHPDAPPRAEAPPVEVPEPPSPPLPPSEPPAALAPSPLSSPSETPIAEAVPRTVPPPAAVDPFASTASLPVLPPSPPQARPYPETAPLPASVEVRPPSPMALADTNTGGIGTSRALVDLVPARRERGGVREIEALLQNLHKRQQRNDELRAQRVISEADSIVPTELARILVAQLHEMEDEFGFDEQYMQNLERSTSNHRQEVEKLSTMMDETENARAKGRIERKIQLLNQAAAPLENELRTRSREFEMNKSRQKKVRRLIEWAEEHFKELKI
ncbi:MAG: RNA polymerase sigma factor [Paludisphaera borealis]|uniref:RNA polymerase sigma factor n=1 Tax=Paludisphaera borealis TaxID=1387353 RepID=UPI0028402491|nr:RNA polymerase sigma factor [Paludisphaera borealis]MDR3621081.1 RNA polymerase sigma factor [Paludisphaera borealis]